MVAKSIFKSVDICLIDYKNDKGDDIVVTLHQLQIKQHKRVAKVIDDAQNVKEGEDEEPLIDVLVKAAAVAMETFDKNLSDPEVLEDHADWDTINYILEVGIGFTMNDPNLQAATAEAMKTS